MLLDSKLMNLRCVLAFIKVIHDIDQNFNNIKV